MFKKFIFIFIILSLSIIYFDFVNAQVVSPQNLFNVDADTVALWRFNDIFGTTVTDETGVNNGTAIGTTITDGKFGKARYFNGIGDYITVPDNPSLRDLSQITIEAWVYPTGFDLGCWANNESFVQKGKGDESNAYSLKIMRNQEGWCASATSFNQLNFNGNFGGASISTRWFEPNQWYYVVSTYDGSYSRVYVNGILEAVSTYSPNLIVTTPDPLYINSHTWGGGYQSSQGRMQGIIDEIRISKVARSAEEIAYYYNLAVSPLNQPPAISNLGQFKSDGQTQIIENTITTDSTVIFKTVLNDPNNDQAKLQIELKEFNQPFNEQNLIESNFVNSGSEAVITKSNLTDGDYKWRARAVDSQGNTSQ
ncbi:MAG: LamG domain-containing protein [bacterium]|nr:LamG domain-containing protein [bacterium]